MEDNGKLAEKTVLRSRWATISSRISVKRSYRLQSEPEGEQHKTTMISLLNIPSFGLEYLSPPSGIQANYIKTATRNQQIKKIKSTNN